MPEYHGDGRDAVSRGHALVGCLAVCAAVLWGASGIASAERTETSRCQAPDETCDDRSAPPPPAAAEPVPELPRPCAVLEPAAVESVPGLDAAPRSWERHESRLPRPSLRQSCAWGARTPDEPRLSVTVEVGAEAGVEPDADANLSLRPVAGDRGTRCDVRMGIPEFDDATVEMSLSISDSHKPACAWLEDLAVVATANLS